MNTTHLLPEDQVPCVKVHSCKLTVHVWLCTRLSLGMWCNAKVGDIINHNQALEKLLCVWDLHNTADSYIMECCEHSHRDGQAEKQS